MSFSETWSGLCTPAQIYAVLAFITIIGMAYKQQYGAIIGQAIFAALWTFVLGWICTKGWTWLSWVLVLLPIIIVVGLLVFIYVMGDKLNKYSKEPEKESEKKEKEYFSNCQKKKLAEYFSENQCAEDETWDDNTQACVKNEYFSNQCAEDETWDDNTQACVKNEYFSNQCAEDETWDDNTQACVKNEYFSNQCAEGETWENNRCVRNNNEYFYNQYDTKEHFLGYGGACSKRKNRDKCLDPNRGYNKCKWVQNKCKLNK